MSEYLNSSPRVKKKLSVLAVGTSQVVLSFEALKAAMFELPCKEEQDRIASFLDCLNSSLVYNCKRSVIAFLKAYSLIQLLVILIHILVVAELTED